MAKHWKSFVKKEEQPEKEQDTLNNIGKLLSPEGKSPETSLEDVAEFNSSLKSLIEEQKQLEDQMAELTGKKKASDSDKKYQHDIKTIDQKKKEEKKAAAKRQKRKEHHRKKQDDRWDVTPSFTPKKKKSTPNPSITQKIKKKPAVSDFIQQRNAEKKTTAIPKLPKNTTRTKPTVSKKKKPISFIEYSEKAIQKGKQRVDDFTTKRKKNKAEALPQKPKRQQETLLKNVGKRKAITALGNTKKSGQKVSDRVQKSKKKVTNFVNEAIQKKETLRLQPVVKKASEAIDTFHKVKAKTAKINTTYQAIQTKGTELQTGIEKIQTISQSSELKTIGKKLSKGIEIVHKVGSKLNKVEQLFNTANKKLEKTKNVTSLFEKKQKAVDFISAKATDTLQAFDFDFIQKHETKIEETKGFNVGNKKLNVDFNTIKDIKNGIDTLKNMKKQKDSFSF